MAFKALRRLVIAWLTTERPDKDIPRDNFMRMSMHVRPADVLLVAGRTRVAGVIQSVTLSSWSHAALYVGRAGELPDLPALREVRRRCSYTPDRPLLMEAELGQGVRLVPLDKYRDYHVRICRPRDLIDQDAKQVVRRALGDIGNDYDVRQILDLFRFFFPYGLLPRHWRSTLFEARAGPHASTVCSSMIGRAFAAVRFPILPVIQQDAEGNYVFYRRNFKLLTPRDFDVSPYFDIIKYPFLGEDDVRLYRDMAWDESGMIIRDPERLGDAESG